MLAQRHTTGGVTQATRTMRAAEREEQDEAIRRMVGNRRRGTRSRPEAFGPGREQLHEVSIGGLVAMLQAYDVAADTLSHHANAPRVCDPAGCILDRAAEAHHYAMEEIVEEIEARTPASNWDDFYRREALLHWYVDREEWAVVQALVAAAVLAMEA